MVILLLENKEENMKKQTIKCNVEKCKFNDKDKCLCCLDEINVTCQCGQDECSCKKDTNCASYEERK